MDKDLRQIGGFIYDFYRKPPTTDESGDVIKITFHQRNGLSYYSNMDGAKFLAKQLIMGDASDKVQGLPKYGKVKAEKIIEPIDNIFGLKRAVISEYRKVYGDDYIEPLQLNFRLLYLGKY
jgi:5'-3' exonuclease